MPFGFVGRTTLANPLKDSLDASAARSRGIADRVARASLNPGDGFALPAIPGQPADGQEATGVNIEEEMTALADEQLRYEATAKLLNKAYQQLRASLKNG